MINDQVHTPVLLREVMEHLKVGPGKNFVDATADGGGHAVAIAKAIQPGGKLLAVEIDEELLKILKERFQKECSPFSKNCILQEGSYVELNRLVRSLTFGPVAGVLFDFGLSSFHLEASRRGFSFRGSESLDMRYRRMRGMTAAELIARVSRHELEEIFSRFGEERFAPRIAAAIANARQQRPIRRTDELVEIIRRAIPMKAQRGRIHSATRTFQAIRIAVNRELENIPAGLAAACEVVAPRGRIATLTYHSLEHRLVRDFFRSPEIKSSFAAMLHSPLGPARREVLGNPRARSARLRVFEKIA